MLDHAKSFSRPPQPISSGEVSTADLLERLAEHRSQALVFRYEGRDVQPGYHVTEVKSGAFEALDCGANFESWNETFIQLWDVPSDDGRSFMPVSKFLAIIGKVTERVPFDHGAKLTFEVSDGGSAMQLYRASAVAVEGDSVRVELTRRPASCKPRDRWLEQPSSREASRCRPASTGACCT